MLIKRRGQALAGCLELYHLWALLLCICDGCWLQSGCILETAKGLLAGPGAHSQGGTRQSCACVMIDQACTWHFNGRLIIFTP